MHSSRMRAVCCSGRPGGEGCLPSGGVCPGGVHHLFSPLPVDRILDIRLLKHYLSASTVDGNKVMRKYTSNIRGSVVGLIISLLIRVSCGW